MNHIQIHNFRCDSFNSNLNLAKHKKSYRQRNYLSHHIATNYGKTTMDHSSLLHEATTNTPQDHLKVDLEELVEHEWVRMLVPLPQQLASIFDHRPCLVLKNFVKWLLQHFFYCI